VAHYVVVRETPKAAEFAIVVAHEDHSVGVGTALLKHLARVARVHGIRRFVADVLGENHLMLMVVFDLGWRCEPADYGSVRHLEIELPDLTDEDAKCPT
jgi:GNAT superfamily N-acetyltransferase